MSSAIAQYAGSSGGDGDESAETNMGSEFKLDMGGTTFGDYIPTNNTPFYIFGGVVAFVALVYFVGKRK